MGRATAMRVWRPFVHPNYTLDAIADRLHDSIFTDNFCASSS
jgi:hypothetical protein